MTAYNYFELSYSPTEIRLFSTQDQALEWIMEEVKKIIPTCQAHRASGITTIEGLQTKEHLIATEIVRLLCEKGWEPFSGRGVSFAGEGGLLFRIADG